MEKSLVNKGWVDNKWTGEVDEEEIGWTSKVMGWGVVLVI